jgi:cardiolipin synthase
VQQRNNIYLKGFSHNNQVKLIKGGNEYFSMMLQLINSANNIIHLQTYIYENDETGKCITNALIEASHRKVKVYLLVDGYASQSLNSTFIKEIKKAGIHFRFFEPLFKRKSFYFGRRLHHKVLLTDNNYGLIGGINISNRYNDMPDKKAWFDFSILLEGASIQELCKICWNTWFGFKRNHIHYNCSGNNKNVPLNIDVHADVRIRRNDWIRRKNEISETYIEMLYYAQKEVTIICSYFLPGRVLRRILKNTANKGIKIDIIIAGPSDIWIAKNAERWLYDFLLRNKINIYEYQPSVLHAKMAYCDDEWLTIGSYNINDISTYASIELNVDVRNRIFVETVKNEIEEIKRINCIKISNKKHLNDKNAIKQLIRWLSWHTFQIIFHLVTFYYKRINISKKHIDQSHHTY